MKPVTGMIIGALFALGWQTDLPRGIADHFATFQESALESAAQYITPANQLPTPEPVTTPGPEPVVQEPDVQEKVATPDPPPAGVTLGEIDSLLAAPAPASRKRRTINTFSGRQTAERYAQTLARLVPGASVAVQELPGRSWAVVLDETSLSRGGLMLISRMID